MKFTIIFLISFCFTSIGFSSYIKISPEDAANAAISENLTLPEAESDGRIQTLNRKGAMSPDLDEVSQEFVNYASSPNVKVLEIGASYGLACLEALKLGSQDYHVNDMDIRHLKILARRVRMLNDTYLSHIHLIPATFSNTLDLPENHYDAILGARVFHFMKPSELLETLTQVYKILKPGGCIYAVMISPYVQRYASFIPEFEKRVQNHKPFPGYVENLSDYIDHTMVSETVRKNLAESFLFFNIETARDVFEQIGFIIRKAIEMPLAYPSKIWQLDGRENIGVVAFKPKNIKDISN